MRRLLYGLPAAAFVLLVVYLAIGLTRDPHKLPSAMIDKPAPPFALPGLGVRQGLARDDLAGEVTLVNFFASWCVPCRVEHPMLMRLAAEKKVRLYGIDYKDKPEEAEKLLGQLGDPYGRVGVDADGRVAIDFGVYGVPETYVIDRAGRIRYRQVGPITPEEYEKTVLPLLRELGRS
jgi:cytochrome c biogenesis protein CcmG, thiol:disulfide interchange protein DsbE